MKRKWLVIPTLISLLVVWFVASNVSLAADPDNKIGDNVYYRIVDGTTLEVYTEGTGNGVTYDFGKIPEPFKSASFDSITTIKICSGVTSIGANTFHNFAGGTNNNVTSVIFEGPCTLKSIGKQGFASFTDNISEFVLPEGFTSFNSDTCVGGNGFDSLVLPASFSSAPTSYAFFAAVKNGGSITFLNPNPASTNFNFFYFEGYNSSPFTFYVPQSALEGYKSKYPKCADYFVPIPDNGGNPAPSNETYYNSLEVAIDIYTGSEPKTITWDAGDSLPLSVMKKLAEAKNITLEFTFIYNGVEHTVVIPAGTAIYDESIPWYGPEWLLGHFPEKGSGVSAGVYTIQEGDTLAGLAAKFKTTVARLLQLNPEIKDANVIYSGQKIRY